MKYKNLTKEQIIISIDRLTRFKNTKDKYTRVFYDILTSALIEPKLRKNYIETMNYEYIVGLVEEIVNESIKQYTTITSDFSLNNIIKSVENSLFYNDNETQVLLNNKINFLGAVTLLEKPSAYNLKWLVEAANCTDVKKLEFLREEHSLRYPIEKVILVEGITEEILLPAFSKFLGKNFDKNGIQVIAAGGKNQVVKMYYKLINEIRRPIYILLDKDAEENIKQINPKLRKIDKIHLVSCGEFEDMLPKSLIVKTVNNHFENFLTIDEKDLISDYPTARVLSELFRTKGLHEFKKSDFAKLIKSNISNKSDISEEIESIIKELGT